MAFGFRYIDADKEVRLMQISGGGRLRVSDGQRDWWTKSKTTIPWEIYETDIGHTFDDRATAEMVLRNLVT